MPLHWVYTRPECLRLLRTHYADALSPEDGFLTRYVACPPEPHPDSHKYFGKCDPAAEPVDIFAPHGHLWATPGTHYHQTLPAGGSSLSARLVLLAARSVVADGQYNADKHVARYIDLMRAPRSDVFVDETHRVFFRRLAAGNAPHQCGFDECCLTGIALAVPVLLAYANVPSAAATATAAARMHLQFTHKSPVMDEQVAAFSTALFGLLGQVEEPLAVLSTAFSVFTNGTQDLRSLLASGISDEELFWGSDTADPVFSTR